MTNSLVDYAFADGAARITLTAGDRGNPIEPESTRQLHQAVLRAKADGARVIVLAAEGRFFSVGGDLSAFAGRRRPQRPAPRPRRVGPPGGHRAGPR